ncbi:hypothetical protein [Lactococcus lactis]|uniref:hypothetical protein n=1 Tax=Lactococcus lactis TaxID=1358 RepID=UPI00071E25AD|nr:hypothetical protein [Lactococcus lactis]KST89948.1 prophage pi3 protein 34 [Lactococcus lactis subsp. lactis]
MKIDLSELERKLSNGINLTIKESTILLESMKGFIDDKIELQEQLNTAKKALTEIAEFEPKKSAHKYWPDWHSIMMATASDALAAIGGDDESLDN